MASSVATPLERQFGRIAGVTEMTSSSSLGQTSITLQFDLNRNIDAAARDVEAAINAARSYLPADLPSNPTYRKVNPADSPIMIVALTSDKLPPSALYDAGFHHSDAANLADPRRRTGQWWAAVPRPLCASMSIRRMINHFGLTLDNIRTPSAAQTANEAKGIFSDGANVPG